MSTSALLKLPTNLNSDGKITELIIYTIKDLRNSVAHNNIIFDTRFKTGSIDNRLSACLQQQTRINNITFNSIEDYVILIIYVLRNMGVTKTECKQFARSFLTITETLRSKFWYYVKKKYKLNRDFFITSQLNVMLTSLYF